MSSPDLLKQGQKVTDKKRNNLMSIVSSLRQDLPESTQANNEPVSSVGSILAEQAKAGFAGTEGPYSEPATGNIPAEHPDDKADQDDDVVSNILKLLYRVSSSDPVEVPQPTTVIPPHDDESILEMQHPPEGNKSGIQGVLKCYTNGTKEVQGILNNDVNFLYECKRCRGIFRSLPSLIRHKKDFCRNTGFFSSFMNRPSNSTEEEDSTFQRVLNILHPPEQTLDVKLAEEPMVPVYKPFLHIGNEEKQHVGMNLQPVRVNLVRVTSSHGVMTSSAKPVVLSAKSGSTVILSPSQSPTTASKSTAFGKFFVGRPGVSIPVQKKSYSCPICEKPMAERKNVRRHLINVHMLRVTEALKIMNSKVPTKITQRHRVTSPRGRPDPDFLHQCVETIKLGPNRLIHVLPSTYNLSSSYCPVCGRALCRKTNVRRHILEAHNLIIKGEKKYFQLKEISGKAMSNSPTLRALRFMFAGKNSPNSFTKSSSPKSQLAMPSASTKFQSKPVTIFPFTSSTSTRFTEISTNSSKAGFVKLGNVKFVENVRSAVSSTATNSQSQIPKVFSTTSTEKPITMVEISRTREIESGKSNNGVADGDGPLDECDVTSSSKLEDASSSLISKQDNRADSSYKCPKCSKSFTRRHAFKNHMASFHELSDKEFDELIEKIRSQANGTKEPVRTRHLSSDEEPPPKKLRALAPRGDSSTIRWENLDHTDRSEGFPKVNGYAPNKATIPAPKTISVNMPSNLPKGDAAHPSNSTTTISTGNFILRHVSADKIVPPTSNATSLRPFIKVELKNPSVAIKGLDTKKQSNTAQVSNLKINTSFDFKKLICYSCDKKFISAPDMKRHLLGVHSFTTEDALAACYDCSGVSQEAQNAGLENGFDITLAKCLFCNKLYFSRENLYKHLTRTHHIEESLLAALKSSFAPDNEGKVPESPSLVEKAATTVPQKPALDVDKEEKSADDQPMTPKAKSAGQVIATSSKTTASPLVPISGSANLVTEEDAAVALKVFPKQNIKPSTLRCVKCKRKYNKPWDLKIHLLRHLGLGLYSCKFCPKSGEPRRFFRSLELLKHLSEQHGVRTRNKEGHFAQCRVNLEQLWEAYHLPKGKNA